MPALVTECGIQRGTAVAPLDFQPDSNSLVFCNLYSVETGTFRPFCARLSSVTTYGDAAIRRPMRFEPQSRDNAGPRINDQIRARDVRLIDETGQNVGVVSRFDAMAKAEEAGLDLVEVSPDADPPVCKILDYGKFKFQEQKKAAEARKNQKIVEIKEIKMRPGIDDHDYDVKLRAIKRFFDDGDKVKITLRFRGREMAHAQLGMAVLQRVKADTEGISKVESEPRFEGRQMVMVLAPR